MEFTVKGSVILMLNTFVTCMIARDYLLLLGLHLEVLMGQNTLRRVKLEETPIRFNTRKKLNCAASLFPESQVFLFNTIQPRYSMADTTDRKC